MYKLISVIPLSIFLFGCQQNMENSEYYKRAHEDRAQKKAYYSDGETRYLNPRIERRMKPITKGEVRRMAAENGYREGVKKAEIDLEHTVMGEHFDMKYYHYPRIQYQEMPEEKMGGVVYEKGYELVVLKPGMYKEVPENEEIDFRPRYKKKKIRSLVEEKGSEESFESFMKRKNNNTEIEEVK